MANKLKLKTELKVVYVPLPPEMVEARRASMRMLLEWILEDIALHPDLPVDDEEKKDESSAGED